jgi:S-adenosylmethionine-dependent methyltransferase
MPAGTSKTLASTFDEKLAAWREWQQAPWGRLRYAIVGHVLTRHLAVSGNQRLRIVDVGGGDGTEAIRLAELGHHVTLIDYSAGMLDVARATAAERGVSDRLTCVEAPADKFVDLVPNPFDVALCHFVIGYVDDPVAVLRQIAEVLAPTGWLSVIGANPTSDVLKKVVRERDFEGAIAMLDATKAHSVIFDHAVTRIGHADADQMLVRAGLRQHARYGGHCIMNLIADDSIKHDPVAYAKIEKLELAVCDRSPYRDIGGFWQLIARSGPL